MDSAQQQAAGNLPNSHLSDLGPVITMLTADHLAWFSPTKMKIQDVTPVASYNWILRESQSGAVIPGSPPKWTPPQTPYALNEDTIGRYKDVNSAMNPSYPMQQMVESTLAVSPTLDLSQIHICACAGGLGNLLRFLQGEVKTFRIAIQKIGNTVFFNRIQKPAEEVFQNVYGYGRAMPEAYTTKAADVEGSVTHQRIVRYTFADLTCLVRFEVDGYLEDKVAANNPSSSSQSVTPLAIPHQAVFDLKTRTDTNFNRHKRNYVQEFAPRLWLTRIPTLIIGLHKDGLFERIKKYEVEGRVQAWESKEQRTVVKFHSLLTRLITTVTEQPTGILEIFRYENGPLEIRENGGGFSGTLPPHLVQRWNSTAGGEGEATATAAAAEPQGFVPH